jgi:hypothetical protein
LGLEFDREGRFNINCGRQTQYNRAPLLVFTSREWTQRPRISRTSSSPALPCCVVVGAVRRRSWLREQSHFTSIASKGLFLPWGSFFADPGPHLRSYSCLTARRTLHISCLLAPIANRTIFTVHCGTSLAYLAYRALIFYLPPSSQSLAFLTYCFPSSRMEVLEYDWGQPGAKGIGITIS